MSSYPAPASYHHQQTEYDHQQTQQPSQQVEVTRKIYKVTVILTL